MELKELTNLVLNKLNLYNTNNLSENIYKICENNDIQFMQWFKENVKDLSVDWMQKIYQYYLADRKEKMQDYTPKSIAELMAKLLGDEETVIDLCAGSGALTIQKWNQNKNQKFILFEFDEKVIPFLIFNMMVRNIECVIYRSDVLQEEIYNEYRITKGKEYGKLEVIK